MNEEKLKVKLLRIIEIHENNNRNIPNAFEMRKLLGLNLRKYQFTEFVNTYKQYNCGYF